MTRATPGGDGERRTSGLRPGANQERLAGIAKIDMRTGEIHRIYEARAAGNGAMLATAGDLLFWGDIGQVLRAFDAETGKVLWQSEPLGAHDPDQHDHLCRRRQAVRGGRQRGIAARCTAARRDRRRDDPAARRQLTECIRVAALVSRFCKPNAQLSRCQRVSS